MGFQKRQKQRETREKKKNYVPSDYEHYKLFCREQQKIVEALEKKNLDIDTANIGGLGQYIPKSYMEMMFQNYQKSEENKKNFGSECIVETVYNDSNESTRGDSNIVSKAEAMPR
jgi:hypothetical protein